MYSPTLYTYNYPRDSRYTSILAEDAARREELLLQRRLDQLRQSRRYQSDPYASIYPGASVYRSYDDGLELLRRQVEEEERMSRLEALYRRQHMLQEIEDSRLSAALRLRELEEERKLQRLEWAVREREAQLARAEQRLVQPSPLSAIEAIDVYRPTDPPHPLKIFQVPDSRPTRFPATQIELMRRSLPQRFRKEQPARTPLAADNGAPQVLDLNRLFQQLGCLASANKAHTEPKGEEQQVPPKQAEMPKLKTEAAPKTARTPLNQSTASVPVVHLAQLLNPFIHADKEEQNKVPSSTKLQSETVQATLKAQLEERLNNEYANEVRDTIQALLASLENNNRTAGTTTGPQISTASEHRGNDTTTAATSFAPSSSFKGKSKESPALEPRIPSTGDIGEAMSLIVSLEKHFFALEDEFVFPKSLDFVTSPSTGPMSAISRLTYTATNQPIRFYEQSLSHLLAQLDSIESCGNEELRKKRKEVVSKVEQALEELEQVVERRWNATPREVSSEHLAVPTPTPAPAEGDETGVESSDPAPVSPQLAKEIPQREEAPAEEVLTEQPVEVEPAVVALTHSQEHTPEIEGSTSSEPASIPAETDVEEQPLSQTPAPVEPTVSKGLPGEGSQPEEIPNDEASQEGPVSVADSTLVQTPQSTPTSSPGTQVLSSTSQTDLSATIRFSAPILEPTTSEAGSESESESESGSVGEGFLLENETEEKDTSSKYKDTDEDSTVSDWSEVDALGQ